VDKDGKPILKIRTTIDPNSKVKVNGNQRIMIPVGRLSEVELESIKLPTPSSKVDHSVCYFCQVPLGYMNSVIGTLGVDHPSTTWLEKERFISFYNRETGVYQQVPEPYKIPIQHPVSTCYAHVSMLDAVIPHKETMEVDRWSSNTGSRTQHKQRSVPSRTSHESREFEIRNNGLIIRPDGSAHSKVSEPMPIEETGLGLPIGFKWFRYERFNAKAVK
jgi:hypothetical protein